MPISSLNLADFKPTTAKRAARLLAKKVALPSDAFERLSAEARSRAIRISGVHKVNAVQRVRDIIRRALRDGRDWSAVQREILALLDTEGVPRPQLSRLRTMFRQNAHQAYIDGWDEVTSDRDTARVFPFRQYLTVGNGTPGVRGVRAEHAALHGLVFHRDDPFWKRHLPPWDWGCRCYTRDLTEKQVKSMRVKVRNLSFVRRKIRVPGQKRPGIKANESFVRGGISDVKVDAELESVLREIME